MKARLWYLLILLSGLGCKTEPKITIISAFPKSVAGIQQIRVKVVPSERVHEITLGANADALDVEPTFNARTGLYTFSLDTSVLPNGVCKIGVEASILNTDGTGYDDLESDPREMTVANDISFGPVFDSRGKLIQEGWGDWFGAKVFPIRASAIHYDKSGKVLPVKYTIRIANETGLIRTLTGKSSNGLISLDWNLRDESGHVTTNRQYNVEIGASWGGDVGSIASPPTQSKTGKRRAGEQ